MRDFDVLRRRMMKSSNQVSIDMFITEPSLRISLFGLQRLSKAMLTLAAYKDGAREKMMQRSRKVKRRETYEIWLQLKKAMAIVGDPDNDYLKMDVIQMQNVVSKLTIKELTVREISSISMFLWMIHLKSDKNDRLLTKVIHTILKPEENIILSESSLRCRDLFFSITNLAWLCNNYITNGIYKYMHDMFEQSYSTVICNTTSTVAVSCDDIQVQDKVSVMRVNMWIAVFRGSNVEVYDTKSGDKLIDRPSQLK